MTQREIRWARQHDWFIYATSSGVVVQDMTQDEQGEWILVEREFNDFRKLFYWAGY